MFSIKIDTLLSIFTWIVRQLLKTSSKHETDAQIQQDIIDKASYAKSFALKEAKRAQVVAEKIQALLS
jgi:hypothetical protein